MTDINEIACDIDSINIAKTYLVDEVECCARILAGMRGRSITVVSQNIRSIRKNIDGFCVLLKRLAIPDVDIIVMTECWLMNKKINKK